MYVEDFYVPVMCNMNAQYFIVISFSSRMKIWSTLSKVASKLGQVTKYTSKLLENINISSWSGITAPKIERNIFVSVIVTNKISMSCLPFPPFFLHHKGMSSGATDDSGEQKQKWNVLPVWRRSKTWNWGIQLGMTCSTTERVLG